MSTLKQMDPEDLTLYAMQLLGAGEAAAVEAHLEQSASSRRELGEIRGDLAVYAMAVDAAAPSVSGRTRFLRQIAEEKRNVASRSATAVQNDAMEKSGVTSIGAYRAGREQAAASGEAETRRRGIGVRVLPWVGWAVAAGMAFTAGELYRERQTLRETVAGNQSEIARTTAEAASARVVLNAMNDQTAMRVTLTKKGAAASPSGRTTYSAEKGVLIFTASNLEPVGTFKVYELWLIPADGSAPIPAGTFHPDAKGYANMISTEMPKGVEAKAFGITVEDDGGAKVPTPPILMTGA